MEGTGLRHAHLLAIAPNASSSIICGTTSPSVEPYRANAYVQKTMSGSFLVKNKYLEKLLEKKGLIMILLGLQFLPIVVQFCI